MDDNAVGFLACLLSSVLFGTTFVPVRKVDSADGLFTQWVMAAAIFCIGFFVNIWQGFSQFYPLAMLGGLFWCIGNIMMVPIIQTVGMAIGMLLWQVTNLLFGWASGRFGWFGLRPEPPENEAMNYSGVVLSLLGGFIFLFVKAEQQNSNKVAAVVDDSKIEDNSEQSKWSTVDLASGAKNKVETSADDTGFMKNYSQTVRRIVGSSLALFSGVFFGLCFVPVIYIQEHSSNSTASPYYEAPTAGLPYAWSYFCGIFFTNTVFFLVYTLAKRNRPIVRPDMFLPAFATGTMWAIAQCSWLVANEKLSQAITMPIINRLPGVFAALWSVFYFKEIKGRNNYLILCVAMVISIVGATLTGLSKIKF